MKLTQKQIGFVLDVVKEIKPGQAYMNHYKVKSMSVADACASRLLKSAKIQAYYQKLLTKMEDESIASPKERKQILTEITRGNLTDYQETGADGAWLNIGKESPHTKAISEITSRTDGKDSVITKVKLHNPIQAITELNKMERIYSENTVVDNRTVNINIGDPKEKLIILINRLATRIREAEGDTITKPERS